MLLLLGEHPNLQMIETNSNTRNVTNILLSALQKYTFRAINNTAYAVFYILFSQHVCKVRQFVPVMCRVNHINNKVAPSSRCLLKSQFLKRCLNSA